VRAEWKYQFFHIVYFDASLDYSSHQVKTVYRGFMQMLIWPIIGIFISASKQK